MVFLYADLVLESHFRPRLNNTNGLTMDECEHDDCDARATVRLRTRPGAHNALLPPQWDRITRPFRQRVTAACPVFRVGGKFDAPRFRHTTCYQKSDAYSLAA